MVVMSVRCFYSYSKPAEGGRAEEAGGAAAGVVVVVEVQWPHTQVLLLGSSNPHKETM